jgi:glycosyltransferase involved in cell wall biosynthesis
MASHLVHEAARWPTVDLSVINAVYATDRAQLGSFSIGKSLRWFRYLIQVTAKVVMNRVDTVVMTHAFFRGPFLKDSAFMWLIKGLLRRKLLCWVHMDPRRLGLGKAFWFDQYANRSMRLPDRWVACAPSLAHIWPSEMPPEKRAAVCNGLPDPAGGRQASPANSKRIVFLSSMTEEKGWRELFDLGERLCDEDADLEVAFYGDAGAGETETSLRQVFENGRWPQRIVWNGPAWGEAKATALQSAGIFCFPSWTEAFPLAVLDAMAFGLPVIASDVGAISDALIPQEGGWLIPSRDEQALEASLREALSQPDLRKRMGLFNRARFIEHFSVQAFGNSWNQLLLSI